MSGHSKWATTKHRKCSPGRQAFGALLQALPQHHRCRAARAATPIPDNNARARCRRREGNGMNSLPKDKIDAAIDKAYGRRRRCRNLRGPARTRAMALRAWPMLRARSLTDNRNRTAADVPSAFTPCERQSGHDRARLHSSSTARAQIVVEKIIKSDEKKVPDKRERRRRGRVHDGRRRSRWRRLRGCRRRVDRDHGPWRPDGRQEGAGGTGRRDQGRRADHDSEELHAACPWRTRRRLCAWWTSWRSWKDLQNVYHTMEITDEIAAALEEED